MSKVQFNTKIKCIIGSWYIFKLKIIKKKGHGWESLVYTVYIYI